MRKDISLSQRRKGGFSKWSVVEVEIKDEGSANWEEMGGW